MKKVITIMGLFGLILVQAQVGINNDNPEATLDIKSEGNLSGTKALKITNKDNVEMVTVTDDGRLGIGTTEPALHTSIDIIKKGDVHLRNGVLVSSRKINEGGGLIADNPLKHGVGSDKASRWSIFNMTGTYSDGLHFWAYRWNETTNAFANLGSKMFLGDNGNLGIGTTTPTEKLEVAGSVKIADGTQGAGKVLTSDATGKASWETPGVVISTISTQLGAGVTITNTNSNQWLDTGTIITLPPGKWVVTANLVFTATMTNGATNEGGAWIRATWCDSTTATAKSADIISNSHLISGGLAWNVDFGTMIGSVIINNTTTTNKTYYLKTVSSSAVGVQLPANMEITNFGGTANVENTILGQRLD